jgi:hypothetical protein
MSTISKLDKNVRMARMRRRFVAHQIASAAASAPTAEKHFALQGLAKKLNSIRKDSRLPGWVKEQAFKIVMSRVRSAA